MLVHDRGVAIDDVEDDAISTRPKVSASAVHFPSVRVGECDVRPLTLRNGGPGAATLQLTPPPASAPFEWAEPGTAVTLPPGGTRDADVVFRPREAGDCASTMSIGVEGDAAGVAAPVSGTGIAASLAVGGAQDEEILLDFGLLWTGEARALTFCMSNGGEAPSRFEIPPLPGLSFSPSAGHVPPGGSYDVTATFCSDQPLRHASARLEVAAAGGGGGEGGGAAPAGSGPSFCASGTVYTPAADKVRCLAGEHEVWIIDDEARYAAVTSSGWDTYDPANKEVYGLSHLPHKKLHSIEDVRFVPRSSPDAPLSRDVVPGVLYCIEVRCSLLGAVQCAVWSVVCAARWLWCSRSWGRCAPCAARQVGRRAVRLVADDCADSRVCHAHSHLRWRSHSRCRCSSARTRAVAAGRSCPPPSPARCSARCGRAAAPST